MHKIKIELSKSNMLLMYYPAISSASFMSMRFVVLTLQTFKVWPKVKDFEENCIKSYSLYKPQKVGIITRMCMFTWPRFLHTVDIRYSLVLKRASISLTIRDRAILSSFSSHCPRSYLYMVSFMWNCTGNVLAQLW